MDHATASPGQEPPACAGPDRHTRKPTFVMPRGACDCHAHVFGPRDRFPLSPERSYTPEDCTAEQYEALLGILGVDRAVLVQGGPSGTDNRVTLDCIAKLGSRARGVAVIRPGLSRSELQALHDGGMRGCRMSTVVRGGASFEYLETLVRETAEWNWHMVLHLRHSIELVDLAPRLKAIDNPFVVDHLGHVLGDEGIDAPAFGVLMDLLETDRCWIKLASLYRSSSQPYPHRDMLPMIQRIAEARPDRMIWGSNWPHPIHTGPMPNDGDIVDLIPLWIPDAKRQHQMLVDNPAALYGFED